MKFLYSFSFINPYETKDQKGSEGRGITRSVSILMDNWLNDQVTTCYTIGYIR